MVLTPTKDLNASISQSITPVRFLDSPKVKQETNTNAECKSRLDLIIKTLQDNFSKWQLAHKRGLALCTSIEAIKTRKLDASNKSTDDTMITLYPKELKPYCDKLCIIASIFEDITVNAKESLKQLRALNKMVNMSDQIFYRTWKLQEFIEFAENLLKCYELESNIKQHVMRELPHCFNRADLIRWVTAWEYPQYVDSYVICCFAFLKQEIKPEKS